LTVGTLEPRKNHLTLFEAMRRLRGRADLPLVVAGQPGWSVGPILAAAEPLVRDGRVILVEYVPEPLLPGLYAGASALVYPSWYEGFGLPVLEALATGTPVVASTAPALREVAGSAADYVSASDADGLAAAVEQALDRERQSEEWGERRRSRARLFTWEDAGERLARLLVDVAGGDDRWLMSGWTSGGRATKLSPAAAVHQCRRV
jgi:alpha-1,3-rhamnosyl/mannosyltransferase